MFNRVKGVKKNLKTEYSHYLELGMTNSTYPR